VAVVGIGHEMHGDDAVGIDIARALRARPQRPDLLVIDAGPVPERCTGSLRQFRPNLVVLIDAAYMGARAGGIRWFDRWHSNDSGLGTHGLPLDLVAAVLESEIQCPVALIGIEPAAVALDTPLSAPARAAALRVVDTLSHTFTPQ
jgi:hydrogenase 3 maturation protease